MNDQKLLKEIIKDKPRVKRRKRPTVYMDDHNYVKQLTPSGKFHEGLSMLISNREHMLRLEIENNSLRITNRIHENDAMYRSLFGFSLVLNAVLGGLLWVVW